MAQWERKGDGIVPLAADTETVQNINEHRCCSSSLVVLSTCQGCFCLLAFERDMDLGRSLIDGMIFANAGSAKKSFTTTWLNGSAKAMALFL